MLDQPALSETANRDGPVSPPPSNAASTATIVWPEPDLCLLDEWRGQLPTFPVDALPNAWRTWVPRAARCANASVDHVAVSLLTVAASQIGHARCIAPVPSWSEPCILWAALVGLPSSGKTPAMDAALHMVRTIEDGLAREYEEACRKEPLTPPPRWLTAREARTIDVIADALHWNPRGMLLPRDECGDWLDSMVRDDSQRPFWLSAWSGRPFLVQCKGKTVIRLPRPGLSILGTIEPDMITAALAVADDRVMARFLFAWAERPSFRSLSEMTEGARHEECEAVSRLCAMPDAGRTLTLEAEAFSAFDGFRRLHDAAAGRLEGGEAAWWGKGPGTVLRLAGTLSFLAWAMRPKDTPEPVQVPAWTIKAATRLWQDYFWPHARAIFRQSVRVEGERQAWTTLRWIKQQGKTEVSRTELRRKALGYISDAATAERIAGVLVKAGWLMPLRIEFEGRGSAPVRWAVNPALQVATV